MFNQKSLERLSKADPKLQEFAHDLEKIIPDLQISCTVRGKEEQELAFKNGNSKAHFGQSPHNFEPSRAIDFVFITNGKSDWTAKRYKDLANYVRAKYPAIQAGAFFKSFTDLPHYELKGWKHG